MKKKMHCKHCHKDSMVHESKKDRKHESEGMKKAARLMRKHDKMGKEEMKIDKVMHEFKEGMLHSGSKKGPKVKNRKQALAIAFSEGRKAVGRSRSRRK